MVPKGTRGADVHVPRKTSASYTNPMYDNVGQHRTPAAALTNNGQHLWHMIDLILPLYRYHLCGIGRFVYWRSHPRDTILYNAGPVHPPCPSQPTGFQGAAYLQVFSRSGADVNVTGTHAAQQHRTRQDRSLAEQQSPFLAAKQRLLLQARANNESNVSLPPQKSTEPCQPSCPGRI